MPNGTLAVTVRPSNIFFAGEDISSVIPQVGKGDQDGVNFTSLFGALKFNLSGDYEVSKITVTDPGKDRGLYGTFGYNFTSGSIIDDEVFYEVARIPASPLALASAPTIYIALPAGSYDKLELALRDSESGNTILYVLKDVEVAGNRRRRWLCHHLWWWRAWWAAGVLRSSAERMPRLISMSISAATESLQSTSAWVVRFTANLLAPTR